MSAKIPLSRPYFDERETEAVRRVLASGWVVQGPEVEAFEAEIARLHRAKHCIAVSSGTAALHTCYLVLGVGPGDAVFIPSFAWPSAANMAVLVGARPVFVDVLPDTYNIDPQDLERRIEECRRHGWGKPRAIVPVHEFGLAADVDNILEIAARHSLQVIEDAACALGAAYKEKPVGTFGALGVFSFHPRKSITTGEGGAIVTNDDQLAGRCRMWRNHGQSSISAGRREFKLPGLNYRLTEIQAAIGIVQLAKFPEIMKARRSRADNYFKALHACQSLGLPLNSPLQTWQTFMVVLPGSIRQSSVVEHLSIRGIEAGPGSVAAHTGAVWRQQFLDPAAMCPVSTHLAACGCALPLHPRLTDDDIRRVVAAMAEALEYRGSARNNP